MKFDWPSFWRYAQFFLIMSLIIGLTIIGLASVSVKP